MKKILFLIMLSFISFHVSFSQQEFKKDRENNIKLYKKLYLNTFQKTFNQTQFDVNYYRLELDLDITAKYINGKVQMKAFPVNSEINQIDLNLTNGFIIDSIISKKTILTFKYTSNLLSIYLEKGYKPTEEISLQIYYRGVPTNTGFGSFGVDTVLDRPILWTLSEPFGARDWWPCKDFPEDKADSADIIITVPKDFIVASNGLLLNTTQNQNKKTFYWSERYPISTYLISVTAYPYSIYTNYFKYSDKDSMILQHFVYPEVLDQRKNLCNKTLDMLKIYSNLFGEYPFIKEKYGHADFPWGGGMEHQTCTSLGAWSESVVAHELAHQWWGDMITCKDFHHIWLNEGFASYCEALYNEKMYGKTRYDQTMSLAKYFGTGTIYVPDLSNVSRIFHGGLSYDKASWVLHMLRRVVNDSTFFNIMRNYYADKRYQYNVATTEDFQKICENYYGKDLNWFFHEWIYEELFPTYDVKWWIYKKNDTSIVRVTLNQTQTNYIFKMPIDITISTSSGDTTFIALDSLRSQTFEFKLKSIINNISIDKNEWILKKISNIQLTNIHDSNFINEFKLEQNYPNPFNPRTIIEFKIPEISSISTNERNNNVVKLEIYNSLGQKVRTLINNEKYAPGNYFIAWDAHNDKDHLIASGIYYYKLVSGNFISVKKMIYLR